MGANIPARCPIVTSLLTACPLILSLQPTAGTNFHDALGDSSPLVLGGEFAQEYHTFMLTQYPTSQTDFGATSSVQLMDPSRFRAGQTLCASDLETLLRAPVGAPISPRSQTAMQRHKQRLGMQRDQSESTSRRNQFGLGFDMPGGVYTGKSVFRATQALGKPSASLGPTGWDPLILAR